MRLNIQPIFIFDGPSRPWKRGGVAGRIDWEKIRLLRQVLDVLKVPHHRAPAEAEAECAQLQKLGIVDAVWTDDGDTLMFGATMLIRNFKDEKKGAASKSDTHVRIYRPSRSSSNFVSTEKGLCYSLCSAAETTILEAYPVVVKMQLSEPPSGNTATLVSFFARCHSNSFIFSPTSSATTLTTTLEVASLFPPTSHETYMLRTTDLPKSRPKSSVVLCER
ncbi:PIN domain-like protein [Delphinella strobiligena]|nr:PIN domain-like protein [Delphinella strobiligena]